MYQQCTLVGNLGTDVELRFTPSGVPVASFSLAVGKSFVREDGTKADKTVWFRITCWRKLAETVAEYLTKGRQVMVVGEIEEARGYLDREGEARASLEVTAQTVRFLGQRREGNDAPPASRDNISAPDSEDLPF